MHQAFSRRSRCEEAHSDLRFTIYDLRWAGNFCFLCVPLVLSLIASARADSTASGPDISVPKDLPRDETHPFVPPKGAWPKNPQRGPDDGYLDRAGNEWKPVAGSTGLDEDFHWDIEHKDGTHTNVRPDGEVHHGPDNFP